MASAAPLARVASPAPAASTAFKQPLTLRQQISSFDAQGHIRSAQAAQLLLGKELVEMGKLEDALAVLGPLWKGMRWRGEGWWAVVGEVGNLMRQVIGKMKPERDRLDVIVGIGWEGMSGVFGVAGNAGGLKGWLDGLEIEEEEDGTKAKVVVREEEVVSFLAATFAFEKGEGKVGEGAIGQLSVTSDAADTTEAVVMEEVRIVFDGGMRTVILQHQTGSTPQSEERRVGTTIHSLVELRDGPTDSQSSKPTALVGLTDLTFPAGKTKVFEFLCSLREPGEVRALTATFSLAADKIDIEYIASFNRTIGPDVWWSQKLGRKRLVRVDPHSMTVLPKPPKMDMKFTALQEQYYTNETISLNLDISNGEDDASVANLNVRIVGDQVPAPQFILRSADQESRTDESDTEYSELQLGTISSSGSMTTVIELLPSLAPAVYDMTLELSYHLVSEPETPISKTTTIRLIIVSPFEANYDFSPDFDPASWPSYFSNPALPEDVAGGLSQKWTLTTRYASFALSPLLITSITLTVLSLNGAIVCDFEPLTTTEDSTSIAPKTIESRQFSLRTQKLSLDDRRAASLDLSLDISWRRDEDSPSCTTSLPIPRLLVASSEPRVLATLAPTPPELTKMGLIHLDYVIENPSMHFLTFGLAMSISDSFAFSGLKTGTLQLLPLSRRRVRIRIIPTVRGEWIRPVLVVRDKYFQKVLKVSPCTGLRAESEGVGVWVPEGDGDEVRDEEA